MILTLPSKIVGIAASCNVKAMSGTLKVPKWGFFFTGISNFSCFPPNFFRNRVSNKGQLISKANFQAVNSSKKQTNELNFTTIIPEDNLFSFVFLEEIEDTKKTFQN